ncbi:MAG: hypothetical protein UW94_C0010G0016 [Parcubacteria group bacterium GW2011_GWA2_45_14]|nr:MAG: hypothetical protein UW94_C0010G0016 [Parcubacteria group bacterium GW2011_GWA2_45_14]
MLDRADAQARDTTRKHHLEDIEQSLYLARLTHGTYPPYDQPSWCGTLDNQDNASVKSQIETALRRQNEKYANPNKPFPSDPLAVIKSSANPQINSASNATSPPSYFYWKRSPASFELYSILEADSNQDRSTSGCPNTNLLFYDYGIASVWRENH